MISVQVAIHKVPLIEKTSANADAWCDGLVAAASNTPEAFSGGGVLTDQQRDEARRYFFTARS